MVFAIVLIIAFALVAIRLRTSGKKKESQERIIDEPCTVSSPPSEQVTAPETMTKQILPKRGYVNLEKRDWFGREDLNKLADRFIAFDVETTGLSAYTDRIIQIGAVLFECTKPTEQFSTFVNPERHVPEKASIINNITDDMLKDAPTEKQIVAPLVKFLGDALDGNIMLVAYNADFDMGFLKQLLERQGFNAKLIYVDTLAAARKMLRGLDNYKQTTVAEHLGISLSFAHRADADAEVCGQITTTILPMAFKAVNQQEKLAAGKIPTPEEKGVCAYVIKLLAQSGRDTSRIRFEKKSGGDIRIKNPYSFALFRLPKRNPLYFEIRREFYTECSLQTVPLSGNDGITHTFRIQLRGLEDIDLIATSLMKGFDETGHYIDEFYDKPYVEQPDAMASFTIPESEIDIFIAAFRKSENEILTAAQEKEAALIAKEAEKAARRQAHERRAVEKQSKPTTSSTGRKIIQYDDEMKIIHKYDSVLAAAKAVGISSKSIRDAATGRQKHAAGFVWKYVD